MPVEHKTSCICKKSDFCSRNNFPFLANELDNNTSYPVNGRQDVLFESVMSKHCQKPPLPRDFKIYTSQ